MPRHDFLHQRADIASAREALLRDDRPKGGFELAFGHALREITLENLELRFFRFDQVCATALFVLLDRVLALLDSSPHRSFDLGLGELAPGLDAFVLERGDQETQGADLSLVARLHGVLQIVFETELHFGKAITAPAPRLFGGKSRLEGRPRNLLLRASILSLRSECSPTRLCNVAT